MATRRHLIAGAAAAALLACGESRQEKFESALRVAESAQQAVATARQDVAEREASYEKATAAAREAEDHLARARGKLDAANATLAGARAEVAKWADDASVFRVVQQRLLEEDDLADAAVSARVESGVVVLEGHVTSDADRDLAVEIARATPGVVEVRSLLGVGTAAVAVPPPESVPVPEPLPLPVEPAPAAPAEPIPPDSARQ